MGGGSLNVLRRPLFLAFLTLIVFVSVWYHWMGVEGTKSQSGRSPGQRVKGQQLPWQQPAECVGRIEEIQVKTSGKVLVLTDVFLKDTTSNERIPCKKILIFQSQDQDLFDESKPGNQLYIKGTYTALARAGNPGEFDERLYYSGYGIDGKLFADLVTVTDSHFDWFRCILDSFRQQAADRLFELMEEDDAGILCAMLLGEKAYLPEEEKEMYQRTGIGHMLVISGVKTLKLDIPLVLETRINWAFVPLHIAIIYILKLCLDEEIISRCRFPCSRGYFTKCINWQKKQ